MNIRLSRADQIKVQSPDEIFHIMQKILLKEDLEDRMREHFWTVSLDNGGTILNIELVSLGTATSVTSEPMEVLSIPLQKKVVKLVLVHNHPSGVLTPSEGDKVNTDRLIQACNIMKIELLDHLIITENSYYSFADSGLLDELRQSTRFVPPYLLKQRYEKAAREKGSDLGRKEREKEMAKAMLEKGYAVEEIMELTGLTKTQISRIKR